MWMIYAAGSAFFAGLTSILAKCGIRKTDSTVATAVRTIVVLLFSWGIVGIVGSGSQIFFSEREDSAVPCFVRSCHRRLLALLFPCPADRRYQ